MVFSETDILIIGAGPSGSIAAAIAHKHGMRVRVVEKMHFPRFVIGESLLPKCMEHFETAGFLEVLKTQNYQVKRGVRILRDDQLCWFDFSNQYTDSWKWTWQVPRANFDKVLTDELTARGVNISFGATVVDVKFSPDKSSETTVQFEDGSNEIIHSRFLIDASGYGRVLPRLLHLDKPSGQPPRKAIFGHFTDTRRPDSDEGQQSTLVIHKRDVWAWVIPFSNGTTSVGFVGDPAYLDRFSGTDTQTHLRDLIRQVPFIDRRFHDQEVALNAMISQAYTASTKQTWGPGYAITGNSSEFIDPVFSSGVTLATESGMRAAELAIQELKGVEVSWQEAFANYMTQGVETFRTYVNLWYEGTLQDIFFFAQDNPMRQDIRKQICSVLAGFVWDTSNPFVNNKRDRLLKSVSQLIKIY